MTQQFYRFANNATTMVPGGVANGTTTSMTVASNAGFPSAPFVVVVDQEYLLVTANPSTSWTVVRGWEGSAAASHLSGASVVHILTQDSFLGSHAEPGLANVRLSFDPAAATQPQGSGSTLYAVPYLGNKISLVDPADSRWRRFELPSGVPLGLTGAVSTINDVFAFYNSSAGVVQLESRAWSSLTARTASGELDLRDGVHVRHDDPTRRYLGSWYNYASGYAVDDPRRRYVWNRENRRPRLLSKTHNFDNYAFSGTSVRAVNADFDERVEFLVGVSGESLVRAEGCVALYQASVYGYYYYMLGFGVDDATQFGSLVVGAAWPYYSVVQNHCHHSYRPDKGLRFLQLLEQNSAGLALTVYGAYGAGPGYKGGIYGEYEG
jgi:hypothetical protein